MSVCITRVSDIVYLFTVYTSSEDIPFVYSGFRVADSYLPLSFISLQLTICSHTNVTPEILLREFVVQLYHTTELQHATVHVAHCNFVA